MFCNYRSHIKLEGSQEICRFFGTANLPALTGHSVSSLPVPGIVFLSDLRPTSGWPLAHPVFNFKEPNVRPSAILHQATELAAIKFFKMNREAIMTRLPT